MKRFLFLVAALATLVLFQRQALASHFRQGTIHWSLQDPQAAPTTVTFRVTYGILAISPPNLRTVTIAFGDGTDSGALAGPIVGNATDAEGQAFDVRELVVKHTYAAPGSYTAFFDACCRIASLVNGANQPYHVSSVVTLQAGNASGPVTASPPVVELQLGAPRTYVWPVTDPDGDPITCRFGTDAEAGFVGSVPVVPSFAPGTGGQAPALASHPDGCELGWDLTDAKAGQRYTIHLVFESQHDGQVSTTSLDFIVEIVTAPPPVCAGGGAFVADVGQPVSVMVTGTHTLPTNLSAAVIGTLDATLTPGGPAPSPFETTFSWTPDPVSAGTTRTFLINFTNEKQLGGACYVAVSVAGCIGAGIPCSAGIGACHDDGQTVCIGGGMTACDAQASAPETEVCDGLDNDCNGTNDDGFDVGATCSAGMGQCAQFGAIVCDAGGGATCDAALGEASPEICGDGLDQDCDGVVDNGCGGSGGSGGSGGHAGGAGGGASGGGGSGGEAGGSGGATGGSGGGAGDETSGDETSGGCGIRCALAPAHRRRRCRRICGPRRLRARGGEAPIAAWDRPARTITVAARARATGRLRQASEKGDTAETTFCQGGGAD